MAAGEAVLAAAAGWAARVAQEVRAAKEVRVALGTDMTARQGRDRKGSLENGQAAKPESGRMMPRTVSLEDGSAAALRRSWVAVLRKEPTVPLASGEAALAEAEQLRRLGNGPSGTAAEQRALPRRNKAGEDSEPGAACVACT